MKIYLVGGAVRDTLMGLEPKDKDYVVVGSTPAEMLSRGFTQVGASFPVFLHPVTGDEYALARTEQKNGVGYNGFAVAFDPSITLEQDLIRRDLTINSMAMDLDTGEVIDPYGGRADLVSRTLRHTSEAFAEDPVRVLRIARFAARYDFTIADDTFELMDRIVDEIDTVPAERVFAEFAKGLAEKHPIKMFDALVAVNADRSKWLKPYIYGHRNMAKVSFNDADPLYVRFGIIASNFTDRDFETHKIPVELSRVAKAVWKNYYTFAGFDLLDDGEFLDMCDKMRAFSDQTLLNQAIDVIERYTAVNTFRAKFFDRLNTAMVDTTAIAATCSSGKEVKAAIRKARLEAMATE